MASFPAEIIRKIIDYFNQCYQSDNREHRLWDVFSKKNEYLRFLDVDQSISLQKHNSFTVPTFYGNRLDNSITMYRREKTFLLARYFVVGKLPIARGLSKRLSRVCAPLLIYEASLEDIGTGFKVSVDHSFFRWNSHLLGLLTDDKDIEQKLNGLIDANGDLDLVAFQQLMNSVMCLERELSLIPEDEFEPPNKQDSFKWSPDQDVEVNYDENFTAESLGFKSGNLTVLKRRADNKNLRLVSASCILLVKRSISSRGIIDELNEMKLADAFSAPITRLFNRDSKPGKSFKCDVDNVPGILSSAQQKSLINAASKELSVLIGPPGTGKSYTIACIILERFMQGESVLLVTQNEAAVDVVLDKLVRQLGISSSAITRVGEQHHQRQLLDKMNDILNGIGLQDDITDNSRQLKRSKKHIAAAEKTFSRDSKYAVKEGVFIDAFLQGEILDSFFNRVKKWFLLRRFKQRQPLFKQLHQIHQSQIKREQLLAEHINNRYHKTLKKLLNKHRQQLVTFDSALKARTSMSQKNRFDNIDYPLLLKALPIWLCSLSQLHRALPLKRELFDLVIFDEATQCDLASCLPALFRAKRALVVGDPKQLRHISFLSSNKQHEILQKTNLESVDMDLNYRDHSMIDFGSNGLLSQDDVVMLDEHYRSKPEIIAFSNQEFYGGNLRIMTEKPKQNKSVSIEVHQVENGTRVKGVNEVEVDAIIIHLQKLLEDQQRLPPMNRQSIGVLSFFREQAEAIEKQLTKTFTLQTLLAFKIRATTPYGFQGEERDIMLISCALDEDGPAGAYRYLDRPDVFNVSITRARHKQIIFTSAFEHQMPENSLLKKYLQYISGIQTELPHLAKHRAQYISTISKEMLSHDIQVVADYAIAGVAMDLVLLHKGHVLVLDLIGFPGEYQDVHHLERYKIFDRAELVMFPLSFNAWTYQKPTVIEQIKKAFERIHEQSIKNVSIEYQTNLWKKLLPIDPPIAQKFRQIEYKLIELNMTDDLLQLNVLVGVYQEFVLTLLDSLDRLELTYMRYKELAVVMVNKVLSSFHSLVSSQKEGQSTDDLRLTHHHKQQQVIEKLTATIMHLKQLHEDDGMNEEVNLALKGMDELNDQFKN